MATTKAKRDDVEVEPFVRRLEVKLTAEQVAERVSHAAQLIADRDKKESEAKAAAKHAKSQIEAIDAEIRHLSGEVRSKTTHENVSCEARYDYGKGIVTETRLDTYERIGERRMSDSERQRTIPFVDSDADDSDGGE